MATHVFVVGLVVWACTFITVDASVKNSSVVSSTVTACTVVESSVLHSKLNSSTVIYSSIRESTIENNSVVNASSIELKSELNGAVVRGRGGSVARLNREISDPVPSQLGLDGTRI